MTYLCEAKFDTLWTILRDASKTLEYIYYL